MYPIVQETMLHPKPLYDPLGNRIFIPPAIEKESCHKLNDIRHVITTPAFIIKVRDEKLYFFRLVNWNINLLVEVHLEKERHIVHGCCENPTVAHILTLLRKGALISFQ